MTANEFHDLHWNTYVVESRRLARFRGRIIPGLKASKSYSSSDPEQNIAKVMANDV